MYILSASNHLEEYRLVLWKGVSQLYTDWALRDVFVAQIVKTYRGVFRAVLHREVPLRYRLPVILGDLARVMAATRVLRWTRIHVPLRWLHLGSLYLLDFISFRRPVASQGLSRGLFAGLLGWSGHGLLRPRSSPRRILVTRAMGGIGDLLMMTPGLRALAIKLPKAQIDFAIPRSFHPIFDGFPFVRLLDINEDDIDLSRYQRWVNLTDCPAGRVESRQYPNVRRNRIEIFARAMGVSRWRLWRTAGFLPSYSVSDDEAQWAAQYLQRENPRGLPVIGVQPFAADSYRNWPYVERFVEEAARTRLVLVFHHEELPGYAFPNVIKVLQPLRRSIALAAQCSRLVVLDSSFLHFSAALGIPTVAIFGAISGRVRTRNYPNVRLLAPKKAEFPCYPCWRHEHKPCHLTNGRESICFRSITVDQVFDALDIPPDRSREKGPGILERFASWVRYGRE
jgi:ADP-heptose:LPS heptosyltransferase